MVIGVLLAHKREHGRRSGQVWRQDSPGRILHSYRLNLATTMRPLTATALALVALPLWACGERDPTDPNEYELRWESAHLVLLAHEGAVTTAEADAIMAYGESVFDPIAAFLGGDRVPNRKIEVLLMGSGADRRVNEFGRIVLHRKPALEGGYLDGLAHELTHALRYDYWQQYGTWRWASFGFFEEGIAELVAVTVDPDKPGFPFYGYPEDVVAGYWVTSGRAIPHDILRPRNQELNQPCDHQAYPQRASWFRYIDETYGRTVTLAIAYLPVEVTDAVTLGLIDRSLSELDAEWAEWITARYSAIPNADSLAQAYRQWVPERTVCVAGTDY